MSGWLNIACRLNDRTICVTEAHSRNAHDLYARDLTFLTGDDSGAKAYLAWHRSLNADLSNKALTENEYGVLAVDFIEKVILFNRDDWDLTRSQHFDWRSGHDRDMAAAGRVRLVSPDGSVPSLQITFDLQARWDDLVHDPADYTPEEMAAAPFPVDYYLRKPRPFFEYDYAPWNIQQFPEGDDQSAFMDALERHGFTVDWGGWLQEFENF
jgi:hypothetical protein